MFGKREEDELRLAPADAFDACRRDAAIVLDVRTPRERATGGTIPGASAASWRAPQFPSCHDGPVLVVCSHGARGLFATLRLRAAGVDARSIRGGMNAYRRAGLPIDPGGDGPAP